MTHNEGFENSRLADGRLTYPVLLEYLDPDLMKMQFQMSSMRTIGDPVQCYILTDVPRLRFEIGRTCRAWTRRAGVSVRRGSWRPPRRRLRRRCTAGGAAPATGGTAAAASALAAPRAGGGGGQGTGRRRRLGRLGQGLRGGQDRRPQVLFRRAEFGRHDSQRGVPEDIERQVGGNGHGWDFTTELSRSRRRVCRARIHGGQRRQAEGQPAGPADRQPDLSASRADRRRRVPGAAQGHEVDWHRRRRAVRSVELQGVRRAPGREDDEEDARRCRHQGDQLPRRHGHLPQAAQEPFSTGRPSSASRSWPRRTSAGRPGTARAV